VADSSRELTRSTLGEPSARGELIVARAQLVGYARVAASAQLTATRNELRVDAPTRADRDHDEERARHLRHYSNRAMWAAFAHRRPLAYDAAVSIDFPEPAIAALRDHAARLIDSRKPGTDLRSLARDLLHGLFDVCMRAGFDRVLAELAAAFPGADPADRSALSDDDVVCAAVIAKIEEIDLDGRGPRGPKPGQLAECVVAALGLAVVAAPEPLSVLGDDVRIAVVAALARVVEVAFAAASLREAIIADARARCEERLHGAFAKIAAQLDERGMQLLKQPKVPIDAMQAVQRALAAAREAVIGQHASEAIDRAKAVIAEIDAAAAARIDAPITLRATPRDVAIARVCDQRLVKTPTNVVQTLSTGLAELARIAWRAPEQVVHQYSPKRTFAVGEVLDHPKFGRGTVLSCLAGRIEVEFPDGKRTLVHVAPPRG
jgi:hypothetical protein